jgi:hypothetical protein
LLKPSGDQFLQGVGRFLRSAIGWAEDFGLFGLVCDAVPLQLFPVLEGHFALLAPYENYHGHQGYRGNKQPIA